jgi:hypothetical protein
MRNAQLLFRMFCAGRSVARNSPEIGMILSRFSPKGSFCGFFSADFVLSQKWPRGKYLSFFENIFQNIFIFLNYFAYNNFLSTNFFMEEKVRNKLFFASKDSKTARQKQTHAKLVKSARNPPEIGSHPEIFFARQTTFKSARIL